jgi:DNA-binding LytR/AlgR family response regulator
MDVMTLRALIAEDEPILAATLAQALLRLWPGLEIVATCPNGVDALEKTLALKPDMLFLDIKMPGKTGLEVAEELAESWQGAPFPQIVFVTAYGDYALDAFEHAAADYVTKPVNDARLSKTVERLQQRLQKKEEGGDMARMLDQMRILMSSAAAGAETGAGTGAGAAAIERLTLIRALVGNQVRMIPIADVVYFEATDKYVNVVTKEGEALIRTSLKELLPQLDDKQFWQVHRGTIVNANCVLSAVRDEAGKLSLNLRGRQEQLRVSPLYAHLFKQM